MNVHRVEARRWFLQAGSDIEVADTLRSATHFAASCVHYQQAAEKAMKAVLYSQGARVMLGHAVTDLIRQCESLDPAFGTVLSEAALLDQFYIPTRYPNGLPPPAIPSQTYTQAQADLAQSAAKSILQTVENFLGSHPDALD
jgi:HEPN domain-containing protein